MRTWIVAVTLVLGLCAERPSWAEPERIASPAWQSAPTADDVKAAFPKALIGKRRDALLGFDCRFQSDGRLKHCALEELLSSAGNYIFTAGTDPVSDPGFAQAARSLVDKFKAYTNPSQNLDGAETWLRIAFHDPMSPAAIEIADPETLAINGHQAPAPPFPQAAQQAGYAVGVGVVECTGTPAGALADCAIVSEAPKGLGFGQIALADASSMRLNLWQSGEAVAGARIRLPIYIDSSDPEALKGAVRDAVFHKLRGEDSFYARFGPPGPFFPDRAARMNVNGAVTLECTLAATGTLSECNVRDVSAKDFGFETAALAMVSKNLITVAPRTVDGRPVDSEVVLVNVPFIDNGRR